MFQYGLTLKADELFLASSKATNGSGDDGGGIYVRDTRLVRRLDVTVDGRVPEALLVDAPKPNLGRVVSSCPLIDAGDNPSGQRVLEVVQELELTDVITLRIRIRSFAGSAACPSVGVIIDSDFRDLFAIRGFPVKHLGSIQPPEQVDGGAHLRYRAADDREIGLDISVEPEAASIDTFEETPQGAAVRRDDNPEQAMTVSGMAVTFATEIEPGGSWSATITMTPVLPGERPISAVATVGGGEVTTASIVTSDRDLNAVLDRAMADIAMLQTTFDDGSIIAAGIPWYVAPFGRDSLIAGLQILPFSPARTAETLRVLARHQATAHDAWREADPGKILHEVRYGELARTGQVPHSPYYGTVDATPLFAWITAETVAWTGDEAFWREMEPHVRAAVGWMITDGDLNGDGLIEYPAGQDDGVHITNQGWKDSGDSLNGADGKPPAGPIALVEVQGYAYAAYRRVASIARLYGDAAWADDLDGRADRLQTDVESRFWLEDLGTYAQALDGEGHPVAVVSSNAGHLLVTGLPSPERATRVVSTLASPEMSSGWGLRTLATSARTYNPMSYHNGSVWPHDNSIIVAGLARYGAADLAVRVFGDLFEVAMTDRDLRLPELFCGFARDGVAENAPVAYPVSCIPQAWAAGSIPFMLAGLLGLAASVDGHEISVEPVLPEFLDWVEITGLNAGGRDASVRIERADDGYAVSGTGPIRRSRNRG